MAKERIGTTQVVAAANLLKSLATFVGGMEKSRLSFYVVKFSSQRKNFSRTSRRFNMWTTKETAFYSNTRKNNYRVVCFDSAKVWFLQEYREGEWEDLSVFFGTTVPYSFPTAEEAVEWMQVRY
jgi:hypothetical protein